MTENAIDVLLPKTKEITMCGKTVCIKPLTVRQIFGVFAVIKTANADIAMPATGGSNQDIALHFLSSAGESLPHVAAILTGEGVEALRDISINDASELALAVSEVNDFGKIFANFQKAMELSLPKAK